jgi:CheY-like chemotaxis protein
MSSSIKTILVADDQDDERTIQRAMLEHVGYRVVEASDGAEALEVAMETPVSLVLLDVAMPGMDGFSVCRALRARPATAEVPILFYTASIAGEVEEQVRQAGGNAVLIKPMDPHEVAEVIRGLIGSPEV